MTPQIQTHLHRGRAVILRRAALCGVLSGGALALAGLASIRGFAHFWPHLGPSDGAWSGLLALAAGAILAAAALRVRRARDLWPAIWDRTCGLPQTVTTAADLARLETPGPWEEAFLATVPSLPLPDRAELRRLLPENERLLVASLLLSAGLSGVTYAWSPFQTGAPEDVRPPDIVALKERTPIEADTLRRALDALARDSKPADRVRARAEADTWHDAARERARARLTGSNLLGRFDSLRALATWLRDGGSAPALDGTSLTDGERHTLSEVARHLDEAGVSDVSRWIEAQLAGDTQDAPTLTEWQAEWNDAELAVALMRGTPAGAASFRDDALASGGDQSADTKAGEIPEPDDPATSSKGEPGGDVRLDPGRDLGEGRRLDGDPIERGDAVGRAAWDELLARPEIEARWIPVVERYRQLRNQSRNESRNERRNP